MPGPPTYLYYSNTSKNILVIKTPWIHIVFILMFWNFLFFFEFVFKSQKCQAMVLAWENLQWGFCDVGCCLYFVVVRRLLFFFIHIFFSTSFLTLPWTIARFLHIFCTFSPAHRRVVHDTFIFNHSIIFLTRALWFWVGIFYLTILPNIFGTTCFYQSLPGSR